MEPTTITAVHAWQALDSRGTPTVACRLELAGVPGPSVVVPSGASTGAHEAREVRDGGRAFGGRGVRAAVGQVHDRLAPAVVGIDAADLESVDAALRRVAADGADPVGGNATLAVSLAALVSASAVQELEVAGRVGDGPLPLPLPMINVLSGGAHAGRLMDVQDVLVVPLAASSFAEALAWTWEVREAARAELRDRGHPADLVADEGGYAAPLTRNAEAFEIVVAAIARAGLEPGTQVALAVDVAATELLDGDHYHLRAEGRHLDAAAWREEVVGWCRDHPIVSIEDPAGEDDWDLWRALTKDLADVQVLGDDLFVTNRERLEAGRERGAGNAVLVKPNQIGTLSQAREVVALAHDAGFRTVLSARSGDTEDAWLADLAVAWDTGQIKVGSLARSERTAKWNRLLELEATAPTRLSRPFDT
jgi:enolase